ncbi:hypothetical protein BRADI_2g07826v3 [Brachypodium distachyon]|uniref:Reverse transcriptase zinc-binding domain-containing protein n=1 Tax=Brachypodium distachyon TaxID=15368 RepID=A0A2K2D7G2_BRADI|nr:hypothetical protein BRADI_2g07826v3 [Brachypodium distachyon]
MDLFRASTWIQLGDGAKTLFWHDPWLPDGAIASARWPRLYAIATRKLLEICPRGNHSNNWIRSLQRIATSQELSDFVDLWGLIAGVNLTDAADTISWRWSSSGSYSAASAYKARFVGSIPPFATAKIWKAHAEPKIKFFAWMAHPETIAHLFRECSFTTEVWNLIKLWSNDDLPAPTSPPSIDAYWDSLIRGKPLAERRAMSDRLLYAWWGVWKERNRRVFRNAVLPALQVAHLIWEDIRSRLRACSSDPGD